MRPPAIPPDAALAVAGRLDPATRAALAEARRIRDGWRGALSHARDEALAGAAAELEARWQAAQAHLAEQALDLAVALATRLGVDGACARLDDLVSILKGEPAPAGLQIRVAPATLDAARERLPPGLPLRADPGLAPDEVSVDDPHDLLGARVTAAVAALVLGP